MTPRSRSRWCHRPAVVLGAAVLLVAWPAPARAQNRQRVLRLPGGNPVPPHLIPDERSLDDVEIDSQLRRLSDRLDDPSWERREEATGALIDGGFDIAQLCAVLASSGLSTEQKYRLLMVVREQLVRSPGGAVGIRVDERWLPHAIVVEELLPNLPAAGVLRVGDRITHLEGVELQSWVEFRRTVQFRAPGDRIRLTVERPVPGPEAGGGAKREPTYQTLTIDLRLGSARALVDPATGLPQRNRDVEAARLRDAREAEWRYAPRPRTVAIEPGVPPAQGDTAANEDFDPDDHPYVQALLRERRMIEEGRLAMTPERREAWTMRLEQLEALARDPTLSVDEIQRLRQVTARLTELMR